MHFLTIAFGKLRLLKSLLLFHLGKNPILILTMGKVGSKSLYADIKGPCFWAPVFFGHALNSKTLRTLLEPFRSKNVPYNISAVYLQYSKTAADLYLKTHTSKPWHVITAVRDPLARTISNFFTNLPFQNPDLYSAAINGDVSDSELVNTLVKTFDTNTLEHWFDAQITETLGIDVYMKPFSSMLGYATYGNGNTHLLVLRLEDYSRVGSKALSRFLGRKIEARSTTNASKNKKHADIYARFTKEAIFPKEFVDMHYNSKMARHFYTQKELETLRAKYRIG